MKHSLVITFKRAGSVKCAIENTWAEKDFHKLLVLSFLFSFTIAIFIRSPYPEQGFETTMLELIFLLRKPVITMYYEPVHHFTVTTKGTVCVLLALWNALKGTKNKTKTLNSPQGRCSLLNFSGDNSYSRVQ